MTEENTENLQNLSNAELIKQLLEFKKENSELKSKLSKKLAIQVLESKRKRQKSEKIQKTLENSLQKKYAFSLFYIGIDYQGFEFQKDSTNTIEYHLFYSLKKTMLIKDIESANYTRAGRTDKGVSAFSNILSLKVRSNEKNSSKNSLNYAKMINGNLPADIRITGFVEVEDDFNARYCCIAREYRYFFVKNLLEIETMREACKLMIGEHDFRNFCKVNPSNALDYIRTILSIEIEEIKSNNEDFDERMKMYCFLIKGKSFLWHQIRCMVEVLFLIGNKFEEINVVKDLLDVEKNPRRPSYSYAADFPLVLSNCYYNNLEFKYQIENNMDIYEKLKERFIKKHIESLMYSTMMRYFTNISFDKYIEINEKETLLQALIKDEYEKRKKRSSKRLMERPAGLTLEESISNLKGKDKYIYEQKLQKKTKYEEKNQMK